MQNDDLIKRYYSQLLLDGMSVEKQKLLSKKSVTVIGCGGLGSPLATYLAGSGIGNITLIDHDVVELRNLHRQVFYCENDIGTNKVDVLAKYLKSLNSNISIQTNAKRSWDLVNKDLKSDLLIDCADNLRTSYSLNKVACEEKIGFLTASVAGNIGQISLFDNEKNHCCLECIFPKEGDMDGNDCADIGILGPSVALIASIQTSIAIDYLIGEKLHVNQIYRVDTKNFSIQKNKISPDSSCKIN